MKTRDEIVTSIRESAMEALSPMFDCAVGLHDMEKYFRNLYVALALEKAKGKIPAAAAYLGIHRDSLRAIIARAQGDSSRYLNKAEYMREYRRRNA